MATRRSCGAAFVRFSVIEPSCRPRWWLDVADGGEDLPKQRPTDCDLGQLESDLTCMTHNTRPGFDQAALDAAQRPVGDLFREVYTLQEDTEVVSQCVKLKPDLIVTEPLAGQPGPGDSVLVFLDMLLGGAALIVEAKQL